MVLRGSNGRDRERERRRERKKRGNRKYGQAQLKPSKKGIISCMIAAAILLVLLLTLALAYVQKGKAAGVIGGLGFSAFLFTFVGVISAIRGFRERDKDYITCKIGLGTNLFFMAGFVLLFFGGIF